MPTIGGEGGIRRTLIPGQGLAADVAARASELALRLAVSLERSHGWEAQETARLLDEVRRLPAAAQEAFLAAAAGAPRGGPKEWGERIARACPEGSERELGTVTRALETLGRVAAPARPVSVDTLERARSFGPFGSPTPPVPPSLTGVSLVSAATASGEGLLEGLSATWRTTLARVQETAPGLVGGIAPIGRAEGAVAAVREGLARIGAGEGFWARARRAASEDALGRVASRFEVLRDRVNGGLEAAGTIPDRARGGILASLARELRGEAAATRRDVASARELVGEVGPDQEGAASSPLSRAEGEMQAAEYGLEAYATQQDLVSESRLPEESRISQEELDRLGTGLTPPPPQGFWNIGTVGVGLEPAFSCDEYCQAAAKAVAGVLGENPTSVRTLDGAELAAAIRDIGVPLEQVDPNQLKAALSYINTGASGAVSEFGRGAPKTVDEQRERLTLALRQFRSLAEHGPAPMDRRTAIEVMWSAARIPGHAFEKMSDAEVLAAAQQTAAACNTPGSHEFKVGKHTVKLTIGEGGSVLSTSTKKPGFWSGLGRIAKGALTVASFIPGPVGLVARGIQAGIALVNTVRHGGGLLDIVSAGASFVGAGALAVGRMARTGSSLARIAGNVARVANSVAGAGRGVQGIQRGGLGGALSGAAGVANGLSGAIQGAGAAANSSLGGLADDLSSIGRTLGRVGAGVEAAEGYIQANRAVAAAREELQQARASGDLAQIQAAEKRLAEAEQGKRSAVLGGLAAAGQIAGDTLSRNSSGQLDPRTGQVPPQGRSAFQVGAEVFARGMSTARGLNEDDLLAAGAEALGGVAAARQGTKPIGQELVIGPDGRPVPLRDEKGIAIPGRFQTADDFNFVNQASSVLDGMNDWRTAARGEGQAREALDQAERAASAARASGDPEAIQQAEANLRMARQGLVQAEMGRTLALDNAAQRFTGAVDTFQNSRAADAYHREERHEQGLVETTRKRTGELAAEMSGILRRHDATPTEREWAVSQLLALARADQAYQAALQGGDAILARDARLALEEVQDEITRLPPPLARVASLGVPDVPRVSAAQPGETKQADTRPAATFYVGPVEEFGVMVERVAEGYEPRDPATGLLLSPEQIQELAAREETKDERLAANKEWAESRLGRLDELFGEGFGQYAEITIEESAFRDGRVDPSRVLEALESRVGQYAAMEVPQLRVALGEALREAKPGDVLDISELYSVAYQSSRARALSVAESIGEPGSIRYWSALVGQADYAPADLVQEARLALVGDTADALALALGAYAVGRGVAQVGRAFLRENFAPPPTGVLESPINRGVGTANPLGYAVDVYADYRLRAIQRQVTAQVDAAITAGDRAALEELGGRGGEIAGALRGEQSFRGTIIDVATKERVRSTFDLQWLKSSDRGYYGPDLWNPWTMRAWDVTTTAQWRRHVMKYIVSPKPARPVWRSLGPLLTK